MPGNSLIAISDFINAAQYLSGTKSGYCFVPYGITNKKAPKAHAQEEA